VEAVITLTLGVMAKSLALIAFGLDSIIELFASGVVVWHMRDPAQANHEARTRRALRLVSVAFYGLALFLAVVSIERLVSGARPEESAWGIAYLALTAFVMFLLARLKGAVARQLDAGPLAAEAHVSLLDGFLASAVLLALVLNSAFGWWWADAAAALVVAGFAFAEGREHWEEAGEA
jgi:divalent metal cation (Fe/Co/Zn/Cd) transporter